ncbi:site-specific integrase [Thauera sp. CAU 1555]|uniref:Site-specific integrase n=1 Tax=Thauera sedimentorum TaxID=2767595 RepID=A0ABR9BEG2_9RHOO|nr:site-specific integrase [Thauera sedimentorum]MBC9073415.1 site-specific integrase [Thauera sedimentorum]MBD8504334.1 site-specific integrase [Thauera sedimentorum]
MSTHLGFASNQSRRCLPSVAKPRNGSPFDPTATRWTFHDGIATVSLNFGSLEWASPALIESMKMVLVWYAEHASAGQLKSHFYKLRRLVDFIAEQRGGEVHEISGTDLINYRSSLRPSEECLLGAVASCLKKWHALQIPGVTEDALRFLTQVRLKGAQKGKAVLTMDPESGPFSDIEIQAIQDALNGSYAAGSLDLGDYVLAWLFILLGQRPQQFALLKICDVIASQRVDGSLEYIVRVPRIKQHNQTHRDELKERLLTPSFGRVLYEYARTIEQRFEAVLADPKQAPLFPAERKPVDQPFELAYHMTSYSLGRRFTQVVKALKVWSERTGTELHITPTRFRYSLGTRAAKEGHGELIIAELLDHSDTQNVGVYVKATPEIVERIDRAVALRMAPLARAFAGTIISDDSEAIRGDDPISRIIDPRFDDKLKPMGNCGRNGSCGFMAPISCYTCNSFQAWVEGPHEAVLAYLIAERARLMTEADVRIAKINDRTILAVAEVVRRVRKVRKEAADGC